MTDSVRFRDAGRPRRAVASLALIAMIASIALRTCRAVLERVDRFDRVAGSIVPFSRPAGSGVSA